MKHIAIIGAGLAGLTAADRLKESAEITVFEKSRGVGGRMATRRAAPYVFDHGAQFFKARTDAFKSFLEPMVQSGIVKPWNARFADIKHGSLSVRQTTSNDRDHLVAVPGMNGLAKFISRGLTVRLETHVRSVIRTNGMWALEDDQGEALGNFDWVVSALPFTQASDLMAQSVAEFHTLKTVKMNSCFALMLGFPKPLALDFDAAQVFDGDIGWISVNNSKPDRGKGSSLLVHSTNGWADAHLEDDRNQVMDHLYKQTSEIIAHDVNKADHKALHRWRYANADLRHGNTHFVDKSEKVGICGDWFIQGKVEAAFTSGFDMANSLLKELKNA